MNKIILAMILGLLFLGCDDNKVDLQSFSAGNEVSQEIQQANQNIDKKSYEGLEHVFKDSNDIQTDGKYLLLIFGQNNCGYCEKLKSDIKASEALQDKLKEQFAAYYINISYDKRHHMLLQDETEQKEINIMTKTLANEVYRVNGTPKLVIGDTGGKTILEIPGYIPADKLSKTLDFILSKQWEKTKDRKEIIRLWQKVLKNS